MDPRVMRVRVDVTDGETGQTYRTEYDCPRIAFFNPKSPQHALIRILQVQAKKLLVQVPALRREYGDEHFED